MLSQLVKSQGKGQGGTKSFVPLKTVPDEASQPAQRTHLENLSEVYEDPDSAQREAEGPRASMDYSEFTLLDLSTSTIIFATDCAMTPPPPLRVVWRSLTPPSNIREGVRNR